MLLRGLLIENDFLWNINGRILPSLIDKEKTSILNSTN